MSKLNTTAKRAFYNARKRRTDGATLATKLYYSQSHIVNVLMGRRNNDEIVNAAYRMSRSRKPNRTVNA
jgi:hypothetical protein